MKESLDVATTFTCVYQQSTPEVNLEARIKLIPFEVVVKKRKGLTWPLITANKEIWLQIASQNEKHSRFIHGILMSNQ